MTKEQLIQLLKCKKLIASDLTPLAIVYIKESLQYMTKENGFVVDDFNSMKQLIKDWDINEIETVYQELYNMGISEEEIKNNIKEYLGGK
ncbi:hypothetical protein DLH72_04585 [Candidatus Gracilibacteria bacterium]|nr:MAG: hypothetical protein DLH72_04585 [Candidatus Gracilibacteria bacterium]